MAKNKKQSTRWLDDIEKVRPLNAEEARVRPWLVAEGDKKLRYGYELNPSSLVLDVGGYEGEWAKNISKLYDPFIIIFEPVREFADKLTAEFEKNKKISVESFGLSGKNETMMISLDLASSSIYKPGKKQEKIKLVKASDFVKTLKSPIDLMKVNIEGGEYSMFEDLIRNKQITKFKNLQIQFHDFVPEARTKRLKLQKKLSLTHYLTYNYPFVWENWRLK